MHPTLNRRSFVTGCAAAGITGSLFPTALADAAEAAANPASASSPITPEMIAAAASIAGLQFSHEQCTQLVKKLTERLTDFQSVRKLAIPNDLAPAMALDLRAAGIELPHGRGQGTAHWSPTQVERPANDHDLAFLSIAKLSGLLRARKVTATELTELALARLNKFNPALNAVVTLTEERARQQARQADAEIASGKYRGPLHGIPWGAKDLLSVAGYKSTWGALPFKDQQFDTDAEVVRRLDQAGAILVAKLSLGALANNDVWFGGRTNCPWNPATGSSGSSAGSCATVSAGLLPFAIGSETRGSIVSPCTRNAVTGLRPTFGRISRYGAMALSWSMDKLGPIARSAEDCAIIFAAIHGRDRKDFSAFDAPFTWPGGRRLAELRVGYLKTAFEEEYETKAADQAVLTVLEKLGATLIPVTLPKAPVRALDIILTAEAGAAFDDITRSGEADNLLEPGKSNWAETFRSARFIPAVEYIQANRVRTRLMQEMEALFADVDVVVAPSFRQQILSITNLTGHPCVVVPNGFTPLPDRPDSPARTASSISFIGGLCSDHLCLLAAHEFQAVTRFHLERPPEMLWTTPRERNREAILTAARAPAALSPRLKTSKDFSQH